MWATISRDSFILTMSDDSGNQRATSTSAGEKNSGQDYSQVDEPVRASPEEFKVLWTNVTMTPLLLNQSCCIM